MCRDFLRANLLFVLLTIVTGVSAAAQRAIPKPLPDHPGNVFLAGEEVRVKLPDGKNGAWRAVDYDGRVVAEGRGSGMIQLGRLPVGHYDVRYDGGSVALAVLAPLKAPTPENSPIACDVALAWSAPETPKAVAANLCALAGINWVRDRCAWGQMEPRRGRFAEKWAADESIDDQVAAGLRVLQVNHSSPPWTRSHGRFPVDLRDAYRFYREMARRWQGRVAAIEPWNEADAWDFGNHTGGEMATMQKASYLGLKAGNPRAIVGQNAFCSDRRPGTLDDFRANRAWPYFDTFNHHNYEPFFHYAPHYAAFRTISAGRPLWLTESCLPVPWKGDATRKEPNATDLRIQADRVVKMFAHTIHEGSAATFYFMLLNYGESQIQFGVLHQDLTPRPGYVAMAAVGRLLADAKALGRIKHAHPNLYAYVFSAKPDGKTRDVLAAWIDDKPEFPKPTDPPADKPVKLRLPVAPIELYDVLGRTRPKDGSTIVVSTAPVLVVLPEGTVAKLDIEPPPAAPPWLEGTPSPVVLQARMPKSRVELAASAYRVLPGEPDSIPIFFYNFGWQPADGRLTVQGPKDWNLKLAKSVGAAPGDRTALELTFDVPKSAKQIETITIEGDFQMAGRPVLSFRLLPGPAKQ
jgi:hypothetical protein